MRTISLAVARRLVIISQHLAGPRPTADSAGILDVVRNLGCIQIDPIRVVAPSHYLVLWSRLGTYNPSALDQLLWEERRLFEDWGHCTSIVPTEDYPIFAALKHGYVMSPKLRKWLKENKDLRRYVLTQIRRHGSLPTRHFQDRAAADWQSTGWTKGRNVSQMLTFLWIKGKIMVARREGNQKLWDLTERVLPKWTPKERLTYREAARCVAEKSIRGLGIGRINHIRYYYIRGIPEHPNKHLPQLEAEGRIIQIQIHDSTEDRLVPGPWYMHVNDLPVLNRLEAGKWEPRTTLLSPFDNLIYERQRIEQLFNFKYRLEIYVPEAKRQYGSYVLPVLHGDQFIGRIDPKMDIKQKKLTINAIYREANVPETREFGELVANAIKELGTFLGAQEIVYTKRVPKGWQSVLH